MHATKDETWFNEVVSSLPDDEIQIKMLDILENRKPGEVMVGDLTSQTDIGDELGVKTLHKMLRNGQVKIEGDGRVFITGFGRRSIGLKK